MISLERQGSYRLLETKHLIKVLSLDKETYAWAGLERGGELLTTRRTAQGSDYILSTGLYRIYQALDEVGMTDGMHLELETGRGTWQGYLMPIGLPDKHRFRSNIRPTHECIHTMIEAENEAQPFGTAAVKIMPAV